MLGFDTEGKSKTPRLPSSESSSSIAGRLPPVLKFGVASSFTYFSSCLADAEASAAADFARDSARERFYIVICIVLRKAVPVPY